MEALNLSSGSATNLTLYFILKYSELAFALGNIYP